MTGPELRETVSRFLGAGEILLWVGRPDPVVVARQKWVICGFCLLWAPAVASAVALMSWSSQTSLEHLLSKGLIILLGCGVLVWPLVAYWEGKRTIYAITNQRVLILTTRIWPSFQAYNADEVGNVADRECVEEPDGSGTLIVAERDEHGESVQTREVKFVGIANVRTVEKLLHDAFPRTAIEVTGVPPSPLG